MFPYDILSKNIIKIKIFNFNYGIKMITHMIFNTNSIKFISHDFYINSVSICLCFDLYFNCNDSN